MISVFQTWVRQRVHNPGILLCYSQAPSGWFDSLRSPLAGLPSGHSISAALRFPAFNRYYEDTKTASARLSRLRIPLGVRYPGLLSLSWRLRTESALTVLDLVHAGVVRSGFIPRRQEALPASLKTPSPLCPALRPRADLHARPLRRLGVAPAIPSTKAPPLISISRFNDTALRLAAYA